MRFRCMVVLLWLMFAADGRAMDPAPLEYHLRAIRSGIHKLSTRSYTTRYGNGSVHEQFTVTADGCSYALFDPSGVKRVEWSMKTRGPIQYQSWYTPKVPKEIFTDDDRSTSYTSYYRSGQKWEQYTVNKQKRLKSYDVYDKSGRLIHTP